MAESPAIIEVKIEEKNKIFKVKGCWPYIGKNRNNKKIPAVTSVEEWTNAEIGVGAAIAAGSQEENGIWALLVIAATKILIGINKRIFEDKRVEGVKI